MANNEMSYGRRTTRSRSTSPCRPNSPRVNLMDELTCGICSDILVEVSVLKCGHRFCSLCILTWHQTCLSLSCPHCRKESIPLPSPAWSSIADSYAQARVLELRKKGFAVKAEEEESERENRRTSWTTLASALNNTSSRSHTTGTQTSTSLPAPSHFHPPAATRMTAEERLARIEAIADQLVHTSTARPWNRRQIIIQDDLDDDFLRDLTESLEESTSSVRPSPNVPVTLAEEVVLALPRTDPMTAPMTAPRASGPSGIEASRFIRDQEAQLSLTGHPIRPPERAPSRVQRQRQRVISDYGSRRNETPTRGTFADFSLEPIVLPPSPPEQVEEPPSFSPSRPIPIPARPRFPPSPPPDDFGSTTPALVGSWPNSRRDTPNLGPHSVSPSNRGSSPWFTPYASRVAPTTVVPSSPRSSVASFMSTLYPSLRPPTPAAPPRPPSPHHLPTPTRASNPLTHPSSPARPAPPRRLPSSRSITPPPTYSVAMSSPVRDRTRRSSEGAETNPFAAGRSQWTVVGGEFESGVSTPLSTGGMSPGGSSALRWWEY
ncbi:hypothetical protein T439DRAFT_326683 [Meredithblackwellia eburnea MCA 4105]